MAHQPNRNPIAFMSYVRFDDAHDNGLLTELDLASLVTVSGDVHFLATVRPQYQTRV